MILRIYTGPDGNSHFEEVTPDWTPRGLPFSERASEQQADKVFLQRQMPGYFMDWHSAPRKQYVVILGGRVEIATPNETRVLTAGDVLLAEDVASKHTVRVLGDEPRLSMTIQLED